MQILRGDLHSPQILKESCRPFDSILLFKNLACKNFDYFQILTKGDKAKMAFVA